MYIDSGLKQCSKNPSSQRVLTPSFPIRRFLHNNKMEKVSKFQGRFGYARLFMSQTSRVVRRIVTRPLHLVSTAHMSALLPFKRQFPLVITSRYKPPRLPTKGLYLPMGRLLFRADTIKSYRTSLNANKNAAVIAL